MFVECFIHPLYCKQIDQYQSVKTIKVVEAQFGSLQATSYYIDRRVSRQCHIYACLSGILLHILQPLLEHLGNKLRLQVLYIGNQDNASNNRERYRARLYVLCCCDLNILDTFLILFSSLYVYMDVVNHYWFLYSLFKLNS